MFMCASQCCLKAPKRGVGLLADRLNEYLYMSSERSSESISLRSQASLKKDSSFAVCPASEKLQMPA